MQYEDIANAVRSGSFDEALGAIVNVIQLRRQQLAADLAIALKPGDRVRISSNVRPKYLAGVAGTVLGHSDRGLSIELDQSRGRFGRRITCAATILNRIS